MTALTQVIAETRSKRILALLQVLCADIDLLNHKDTRK